MQMQAIHGSYKNKYIYTKYKKKTTFYFSVSQDLLKSLCFSALFCIVNQFTRLVWLLKTCLYMYCTEGLIKLWFITF